MDVTRIRQYVPELTDAQADQLGRLPELYEYWNSRINVISRKDMDHFLERHVLHSLGIARVISMAPGTRVLDVGTGGGFPGIPLAIRFPESEFLLVDSIGKKIHVIREVIEALELKNVRAEQMRAEKVKGTFHYVVSRAVTRMTPFWQWIHPRFASKSLQEPGNGIWALKGGDLSEEMDELGRPYQITHLSEFFEEPFFETKQVVYVPA